MEPKSIQSAAAQVLVLSCIGGNAGCPQSTTSIYLSSEGRCHSASLQPKYIYMYTSMHEKKE